MKIVKFHKGHIKKLFAYWNRLGENVPYFFPVSVETWLECLINDQIDEKKKFTSQKIFIAVDENEIIGFMQYGQPAFSWDEKGKKFSDPQIGVIRHFYFDEGRVDAAEKLYAQCETFMYQFPKQHAFYHILGMSCNAHHGKLHQKFAHIDQFILDKGYQVEHENLYYSLQFVEGDISSENDLRLVSKSTQKPTYHEYEIYYRCEIVGGIHIRFIEALTGGVTTDVVYLSWIGVEETYRGQGMGTRALKMLAANFQNKGYHRLDTDTSSTNTIAQCFYERMGFLNKGRTRSYIEDVP